MDPKKNSQIGSEGMSKQPGRTDESISDESMEQGSSEELEQGSEWDSEMGQDVDIEGEIAGEEVEGELDPSLKNKINSDSDS